ncbi:hypothetical protein O179_02120 [Chlamydia trachomatis]|uniref:DUF1207 domain-containing protein n=1 Tax=Chlamydia trachomatis TaxID=813 RepID=UPI00038DCCC5|nr:DUF1207 domain-containing protein [Chlamydia trachomatis]AGT71771.1 hypothetical protein O179_02120 [Chlamydia trachomatis]
MMKPLRFGYFFCAIYFTLLQAAFAKEPNSCPDCQNNWKEVTHTDQLPENIIHADDACYHSGYVQALIDMHFLDSCCQVIVENQTAYLFSLPTDDVTRNAIINLIKDLPFIHSVEICQASYQTCHHQGPHGKTSLPEQRSFCTKVCGKEAIWLPQNTILFSPLVADTRQATNSAGIRFNDEVVGKRVGSATFGGDFIFLRLFDISRFHGDMDIGLQGAVFSVFDLDHPEACMVNSDFFVAALCNFAVNKWSYRFRLWHLSSHLGDEFILANQLPPKKRYNRSDEAVDFFASFRYTLQIRVYGGIGYIISRDLTFPEDPLYFEGGIELRPFGLREDNLHAQPVFAMHFRFWEEHDFSIDQTYIVGMEWSKFQDVGRKVRAVLEYHQGFSHEGQFVREECDYYGFRLSYGF